MFFASLISNSSVYLVIIEQLQARLKGQIPEATASENLWAFNVWAEKRNLFRETTCDPMYPVPELLTDFMPEKLDYWLPPVFRNGITWTG